MLETEMKKLREALEANTKALLSVSNQGTNVNAEEAPNIQANPEDRQDPENPVVEETTNEVEEPKTEEVAEEASDTASEITTQDVKNLAKKKMADGVSRADIKKVITKLGAESIADLDEEGIAKLHAKLTKM